MKYIKNCPECGKALRFPIDRGKIKIRCTCGYTEIVDPDSKVLYREGKFDLGHEDRQSTFTGLKERLSRITLKKMINQLLDFKYRLQNYRYMVDDERIKVRNSLLLILTVAVAALSLVWIFK